MNFIKKLGIITLRTLSLQSTTATGMPALKSPKRVDTVTEWIGQILKILKRIQLLTEIHKPVSTIYKVCPASAWREAERQGAYRGSADDTRDGFIHFSTASQLPGTVVKHFAGQTGLFLIAVDADALGDALKWEPSRGGELFPHLYGELDLGAVKEILDLRARSDGSHDIPELPK